MKKHGPNSENISQAVLRLGTWDLVFFNLFLSFLVFFLFHYIVPIFVIFDHLESVCKYVLNCRDGKPFDRNRQFWQKILFTLFYFIGLTHQNGGSYNLCF